MKLTPWVSMLTVVAVAMTSPAKSEAKHYVAHATVSGPVAVRVWVEGGDMFADYSRVRLWLRADRDCYSSLILVDTAGFIHVLNATDGWLYGGRTYGFRACDLGLDRLDGRGIAYVFAVGSPVPFNYSYYGNGVYVDGFGYRVVGDPFVACREFYMSTLPAGCNWNYVGVGFTRFYVREWVRYPSYLCAGGPYHVRVGDNCRDCASVYASYRHNTSAPYEVIGPSVRFKTNYSEVRHVVRDGQRDRGAYAPAPLEPTHGWDPAASGPTRFVKSRDLTRVVSTSRGIAQVSNLQSARTAVMSAAKSGGKRTAAFKGAGDVREPVVANTREKGAHKKVREAE